MLELLLSHTPRTSPPNYILGLAVLDAVCITLPVTASMYYTYKIAPPDYIGTMAGTVATTWHTIGKKSLTEQNLQSCVCTHFCCSDSTDFEHFFGQVSGQVRSARVEQK